MQSFRNHTVLQLELKQPRLLVIGPNGIGKSNLLEAVELLGSLRSHRCSNDRDLIQWDAPQALIRADVGDGDRLELELRRQGGRQAKRNGKLLVLLYCTAPGGPSNALAFSRTGTMGLLHVIGFS